MLVTLTAADFGKLKASTRQELLMLLNEAAPAPTPAPTYGEGFDWDDVVNLNPDQVAEFIDGCSEQTVAGLKILAERGPVIEAKLLREVGIHNYGHFQGRTTKRARTITGDRHAFLLTWDDWDSEENTARGYGSFAVTETTFRSLRIYFGLD